MMLLLLLLPPGWQTGLRPKMAKEAEGVCDSMGRTTAGAAMQVRGRPGRRLGRAASVDDAATGGRGTAKRVVVVALVKAGGC